MPGCRGRSPRRNKLWDSPFPPGRGLGGWGRQSKLKARLAGSKQGKPPPGAWFAPISLCRPGSALGDARGEAPCIRKQKISPFPPGRGQGGWGQESKLKARLAGNKQGKPPPGAWFAPISQCRPGSALGDARGEAPCIRKQKISPSPEGKSALRARAGGWGRQSKLKAGQAGDKEGKPPRRGRQGQVDPSARRQIRKLSKQPQQQHLELHLLGNFTPQSFLRKILKTSCNLRRIVV